MDQFSTFVITCLNCRGHAEIKINDATKQVMYLQHVPIIACRFRPDLKWGFECRCGNDTRLAPEERSQADMLVSGASPDIVERIVKTVTAKPERKFSMETA